MKKTQEHQNMLRTVAGLIEVIVLTLFYYVMWKMNNVGWGLGMFAYRGKYVLMGIYAILTFALFHVCECFKYGQLKNVDFSISQTIAVLIINILSYFQLCLIANRMLGPVPMIILTAVDIVFVCIFAVISNKICRSAVSRRNVLLVYGSGNAADIKNKLDRTGVEYQVTDTISESAGLAAIVAGAETADAIVINDIDAKLRNDIVKYCFEKNIDIYIVPKLSDIIVRSANNLRLSDTPLLEASKTGPNFLESAIKRAGDILIVIIAMIPCGLIMLVIAAAIKIEDGGKVFYRQKRLTKNNVEFEIIKFRSMIPDAEKHTGAVLASEDDPRITKVGRFIRACRFDELPQIFNILKGELSVVGPRPERKEIADRLIEEMPEFAYRTKVKAGLTGYAQVYGKYNTTPYDKLKMDMIYIEEFSILMDIKMILMTPQILFRKESTEGVKREEK